ncbi:MAG TPA: hypothetical protein RMH85_25730 [Polyangiaceae bacterium LLY-WYZ-15_(1-7)]|nr:hypothetical protein [Myxococcales bacterium]MAT29463.1 hypothetical protein [Sandaracinus sp.]HJL02105.1 hypothetical protein [Polyangiaceae bacterium LLY-WYZ-15_(1-7)]HJL11903.1 hypothetical protein [Polyangiaceae bacterium LLY-WYZ-15_(1-7)]HJL21521.1 hypothetical protein [Polyangiaceae bacterium LLY-WYZ-15_(1-7)]
MDQAQRDAQAEREIEAAGTGGEGDHLENEPGPLPGRPGALQVPHDRIRRAKADPETLPVPPAPSGEAEAS